MPIIILGLQVSLPKCLGRVENAQLAELLAPQIQALRIAHQVRVLAQIHSRGYLAVEFYKSLAPTLDERVAVIPGFKLVVDIALSAKRGTASCVAFLE